MKIQTLILNVALALFLLLTGLSPASAQQIQPAHRQAGVSHAPGFYDTSAFLIGKVAVSVIFVESVGSAEDWSPARKTEVTSQINTGLTALAAAGGMDAAVTFQTQVFEVSVTDEPITLSSADTSWIFEALGHISGVSGVDARERAFSLNNQQRAAQASDWAFTLFVVDSLNDPDGAFLDGVFAFGEIFGPYAVVTYDNGTYGVSTLNIAVARETAHVFGAAYQNDGSCADRTQLFGYLGIPNAYCVIAGDDPLNNGIPRLMKDLATLGDPDITTREQLGWRDSGNTEFVFDPVDTTISINVHPYDPHFTAATDLYYTGSAQEVPFPHTLCSPTDYCYAKDIDINHITSMQYQVDGGGWLEINPLDAAFDAEYEEFEFTAAVSGDGQHTIEIRARHDTNNGPGLDDPNALAGFTDTVEKGEQYRGDDSAGPISVPAIPFNESRNTTTFTLSWDDPAPLGCDGGNNLNPGQATAWYEFTPTQSRIIQVSALGSSYDTFMVIYTGSRGHLTQLICVDDTYNSQPIYELNAVAGTTYLVEFGAYDGLVITMPQKNANYPQPLAGGNLTVSFSVAPFKIYLPFIRR